ncbi:SRPBCC family protein [Actinoplanes sp. CA-015351]|uniref:SRPBCC family protein n=1 Tax=Actinoplanes sp. CA-015351 TaxID=3239897 RepID=UPI003D986A0E
MAGFIVTRDVRAPAADVWNTLVDWPRHGNWVPLTTIRVVSDRPDGVGAEFVARTGWGPLAFDDPMRVTAWSPPEGGSAGRCDIVKLGRVVRGRAWFSVTPVPGGMCRVLWFEDVTVVPHAITRYGGPLVSVPGKLAFAATLRAMAREVESR